MLKNKCEHLRKHENGVVSMFVAELYNFDRNCDSDESGKARNRFIDGEDFVPTMTIAKNMKEFFIVYMAYHYLCRCNNSSSLLLFYAQERFN